VPYRKWTFALTKCFIGLGLIGVAAHSRDMLFPVARGWLGMLGLILFLHFGLFEILALVWRSKGVRLRPVMNRPLCAASLADFWGKRWNTAFNALAHEFFFVPLRFRWGSVWATLGTFFASGLIHEAVISVPARGGYGLPTSYFLFQGLAILFQRSQMGLRLGLGNGWRGKLFAVAVAAGPAFWLFHPPFVKNVIVPMLDAVGSI
jgi:alginate O-acetyltransferase complex protein AlgI